MSPLHLCDTMLYIYIYIYFPHKNHEQHFLDPQIALQGMFDLLFMQCSSSPILFIAGHVNHASENNVKLLILYEKKR